MLMVPAGVQCILSRAGAPPERGRGRPAEPRYQWQLLMGAQEAEITKLPFFPLLNRCFLRVQRASVPLAPRRTCCVSPRREGSAAGGFPAQVARPSPVLGQEGSSAGAGGCSRPVVPGGAGRERPGRAHPRLSPPAPGTCHVSRRMPRTLWSLSSAQYFCL